MAPIVRFIGAGTRLCAERCAALQATADDTCLSSAIEALAPPHTCDRNPLATSPHVRAHALTRTRSSAHARVGRRFIEYTQRAGELLIIPSGWLHQVGRRATAGA